MKVLHTKSFVAGFTVAAVLGVAGAIWMGKVSDALPITFPSKTFYDDKDSRTDTSGYVTAQGTLTGEDMTGGTFFHVDCYHDQKWCRTAELSTVKRMAFLNTDDWPITSWTKDVIVAESQPIPSACNRVKLVIIRDSQTVQYNRIPQPKRNGELCKGMTPHVMKWTLEDQRL